MGVQLSSSSFIDSKYYRNITGEEVEDKSKLHMIMNSVISFMENICDRPLKAKGYTYDDEDEDTSYEYNLDMTVFDGPKGSSLYLPTYPINSIDTVIVSSEEIPLSTEFDNVDGYLFYSKDGRISYRNGFDYGYQNNVYVKWNGGYASTHPDYNNLQYIQYCIVKKFMDEDPTDSGIIGETLGNYKYQKADPKSLSQFFDLPIYVFKNLMSFKRIVMS